VAEAQGELRHSQELWTRAADDQAKYDEANAVARVAEEKLAAAHGGNQPGH
jgi:F-type H+-transporting ATPase subunit epsilon